MRMQVYEGADTELTRPIGEVSRVFPGCCTNAFTNADQFSVSFPTEPDMLKRASLVSSVVLLNYLFFEKRKSHKDHHGGGDGGDGM